MTSPTVRPDSMPVVLARHGLPGFIGSALLGVGALGVGWLPLNTGVVDWVYVELLRGTTVGQILSRVLVFIGVALLLQAWLVLGYDLMGGLHLRVTTIWVLLTTWSLPLLLTPPLFSRDVYSYFAQGKLMEAGYDPYTTGVSVVPGWFQDGVDPMWAESPTPYGPAFLLIERGVANFAPDQPALSAWIFRGVALVGLALMAYYVPRLAFLHGINPDRALWLAVLNPLVIMHFVAGAHNDALMVGLVVAGLALAAEHRPVLGIIAVALAGSVKPIGLLALPFVGLLWAGTTARWPRRIWTWAATAGIAAVTFAITALVAGVGLGWIAALSTPGEVKTWLAPVTALGMAIGGALEMVGLATSNDGAVTTLRLIGMVAAFAVIAWLCLRPQGRSAVRGAALAFLAVVLLGPVVQPWYLLWALPLFAVSGLPRRQLQAVVLLTAGFAVHGMAESSSTQDSLLEATDGLAIVGAIGIVALVLLASRREREFVFGPQLAAGLIPTDAPGRARATSMVIA
jgi:alpha-1,6-mannosyltransferase